MWQSMQASTVDCFWSSRAKTVLVNEKKICLCKPISGLITNVIYNQEWLDYKSVSLYNGQFGHHWVSSSSQSQVQFRLI